MRYPNFELCETRASRLLSKQNLRSTRIDVTQLKYDKDIMFDSIQNYCIATGMPLSNFINSKNQLLSEGCTICDYDSGIDIVLYNDKLQSQEHLNWTLGHEIGHIYMRHKCDGQVEEIEAHFFAAQLLMPAYTIYMMSKLFGKVDTEDVYTLFNVSWTAASKRLNTLNKKYSIRCGEYDKKIWMMMEKHINDYYVHTDYSDNMKRFLSIPMIDV